MPDESFAHLHVHSEFSMLDGAAKLDGLVAECARLDMPALAVTDHGNMHAAYDFWKKATARGVKPILGIEGYVAPAGRYHKKPVFWGRPDQRSDDVSGSGAYTHITMLAADVTGLRNLFRLSSLASFDGFYRRPRADRELISEHAQGVIATTGCPSGEVQTKLRLNQFDEAIQAASGYRDIFGADNYYVEVMDHGLDIERSVRDGLLEIGRALGLKPLATNDSHYVTQDQADAHAALLCVQSNKTLDDPTRFKFEGDGYYLKSAAEMRAYWDTEVPGAADNTLVIADRIGSYDEVFAEVNRLPRFPVPDGETEKTWLRKEVHAGLIRRFPDGVPAEYEQRAEYELGVLISKGFAGYVLVVADMVQWAKRRNIRVGPGRGSAAGSLMVYALGITEIDPIRHGLLFERFLNPDRPSMPDIDLDLDDRRRGEVIRYVSDRWGQENVAQIATFGTSKTKAALKDAARVLHGQAGFSRAARIAKTLPPAVFAQDIPLSGVFDPKHERYSEAAGIRALVESDPEAAGIVATARGLEGLVRNVGVHASAVILSGQPLLDVIPLWKRDDGSIVTAWEMYACEDVGLLKMDLLGLRTLTVIDDALCNIAKNAHDDVITLETLPLDDPAVFDLLARGDTLGVFQLDSRPMRDLLIRMRPTRFTDISAALALYRPGPMAANAHLDYADRAAGRQPARPIHPELAEPLAEILDETYGLLVYQEQVLALAQKVAGYSLGSADLLRKAMGKKKREVLDRERPTFEAGMLSNGYSPECVTALWDTLIPFCDYVFGRAHTTAYGLLSYWTAYLKAHYPAEFMAAQLTSVGDKKDRLAVYLAECRRMGIEVLPPDINESDTCFTAIDKSVRFGLGAIRDLGANVVRSIVTSREKGGRFLSFQDFMERIEPTCCQRGVIEPLIKAGAFDSLGHTRRSLNAVHGDAVDIMIGVKRQEALGQLDLFGSAGEAPLAHLAIGDEEWPRTTLLAHEREMLGLSVSAHPLDGAERILRRHAPKPIAAALDGAPVNSEIVIAGVITKVDHKVSKKQGQPWAIVTIEDLDTSIEVLFFAKAYAEVRERLMTDAVVVVKGRVHQRGETVSVIGFEVTPIDVSSAEHDPDAVNEPVMHLRIDPLTFDLEAAIELRLVLESRRGATPVQVSVPGKAGVALLALDAYPVTVTPMLIDEVNSITGVVVSES